MLKIEKRSLIEITPENKVEVCQEYNLVPKHVAMALSKAFHQKTRLYLDYDYPTIFLWESENYGSRT